jgi:hypothetical protein
LYQTLFADASFFALLREIDLDFAKSARLGGCVAIGDADEQDPYLRSLVPLPLPGRRSEVDPIDFLGHDAIDYRDASQQYAH